jgi:cell division protease FtsH
MNATVRNGLFIVAAMIVIGWGFSRLSTTNRPQEVSFTSLVQSIESGTIASIEVRGPKITTKYSDGSTKITYKEPQESVTELLRNLDVPADTIQRLPITVIQPSEWETAWPMLVSNLLPLVLLLGVFFYMARQAQGQAGRTPSFGQTTARESKDGQTFTFHDVAGAKEAKQELSEIVDFLKQPEKFSKLGAKIPKGVLLMGSPGTGKTLLARATAGEAGVPFLFLSGSEFVEMFVGVGASRVRDLFEKAKKQAPCIVFIDEIDAVGRQRGAGLGGSHDEREQTLNQILVEMDGFEPNLGVILMAATNRPDVLDPALLRPGRFDRRVVMDLPDLNDREEILAIHAKNKPLESDVQIRRIAERTPGFSGADLANLMNEAAILAARNNKTTVNQLDIINSIEKVMLGPERRSHLMNDEERLVTAYHEGGHALVAYLQPQADAVHKISIISRGRAAGYTIKLPVDDRRMRRRKEYLEDLAMTLGGYAAERLVYGDVTPGASNDMQNATRLAKTMVTQWGMSDALGPRAYGEHSEMIFLGREISEHKDYSESKAELIDKEIDALIQGGLASATSLLTQHRATLDRLAEYLVKHETIERDEVERIVGFPPANAKNALPQTEA